jgi:hypothetical protein
MLLSEGKAPCQRRLSIDFSLHHLHRCICG